MSEIPLTIDEFEKIDIDEVSKGLNLPWMPVLTLFNGQEIYNSKENPVEKFTTDEAIFVCRAVNNYSKMIHALILAERYVFNLEVWEEITKILNEARVIYE